VTSDQSPYRSRSVTLQQSEEETLAKVTPVGQILGKILRQDSVFLRKLEQL